MTDSYLHWLTLRELAACWEGGRQANWLSSSWLMAGFGRNGRLAAHHHFSLQIAWKWWILLECFGRDAWTQLVDSHFVFSINMWMWMLWVTSTTTLGVGSFLCRYKYCLHAPKAEIRIRWSRGGLLNKAFRWLNYWTNRDVYLQQDSRAWWSFWTQQQNQSCIKLCVPIICTSLQHWTRRFF